MPYRSLAGKFTICTSLVLLVTIACFAYINIESLTTVFLKEAQDDVETLGFFGGVGLVVVHEQEVERSTRRGGHLASSAAPGSVTW